MKKTQTEVQDVLPCDGQSVESVHAWAKNLNEGDHVALRQSFGHISHEYQLGKVAEFTDGGRRVRVKDVGTFWRTSKAAGKNCFYPTGQLSMIEPTREVMKAAKSGLRYPLRETDGRPGGIETVDKKRRVTRH